MTIIIYSVKENAWAQTGLMDCRLPAWLGTATIFFSPLLPPSLLSLPLPESTKVIVSRAAPGSCLL